MDGQTESNRPPPPPPFIWGDGGGGIIIQEIYIAPTLWLKLKALNNTD